MLLLTALIFGHPMCILAQVAAGTTPIALSRAHQPVALLKNSLSLVR